jgi:hypothetical protein
MRCSTWVWMRPNLTGDDLMFFLSVVSALSRTPIDKGRLGDLDDDRGRGVADGGALRSAARHWSGLPARSRKSATAAILSPTAMRARGFA